VRKSNLVNEFNERVQWKTQLVSARWRAVVRNGWEILDQRRGLRLRRALCGRTGRVDLPETALSLTSSRWIRGCLPKRRTQISGLGRILRMQVCGPRRGLFVAIVTGGCRDRPTVASYTDARERGDSINPCTTWATCESGFGLRKNASAPALRASASASGEP